jgi:predicted metal-binding membrane protein
VTPPPQAPAGAARLAGGPVAARIAVWSVVLGSAALAWLAIWAWSPGPAHHHGGGAIGPALAAWALMPVAMMLPTALPLLDRFARLVRRRPDRIALTGLVAAGFLAVWLAAGAALLGLSAGAARLAAPLDGVADGAGVVAGAALAGAGLYQLSRLKERCLSACRSPAAIIYRRWGSGRAPLRSLVVGAEHGLHCLGCCWALALLVGLTGLAGPAWMLAVAVAMGVEKGAPWGRRLTRPLGLVLALAGTLLLVVALQGPAA